MATEPERGDRLSRPARPLLGYRDTGEAEDRHPPGVMLRGWIILALIAALYLGWTLTVYFLEPGLR
jgi:hypothetical protein